MLAGLESLSAAEVAAMTRLWRRQRRELSTSFGGASMMPAIAPGENVMVTCGTEPSIGDVILYFVDKQPIVHRLVARSDAWLLTWGDANALPDLPIAPACLVGVIRSAPRAGPSLFRFILTKLVAAGSAPLPVLTTRMRRIYLLRNAWAMGPRVALGKAWHKLIQS